MKHVISISSGKDSTALLLLAIERVKSKDDVIPIFCDTGNEHQAVYYYLDYLEQTLDIHIHRLKPSFDEEIAHKRMFIARDQRKKRDKRGRKKRWSNKAKRRALSVLHPTGNPFLDLCLWKGQFPSITARFCTVELKRNVAMLFQLDLIDQGHSVISWQGVRRDESYSRRNASKMERIGPRIRAFRPLVDWTAREVFDYCEQHSVEPNPLYRQGMKRVGCMPCINCSKEQIRIIAKRFPEYMEEKKEWERLVSMASKRGFSTFFFKQLHEKNYADRRVHQANAIDAVIAWSKTKRGGKEIDLSAVQEDSTVCASSYGLCE